MMPTGGPNNVRLNKQAVMNNNLVMGKMPPNGPMMPRGIRPQQNSNLVPNMGPQRHQVRLVFGVFVSFLNQQFVISFVLF